MIELGKRVRDTVSGVEGIATCRSVFLNGCVRISVQPSVDKDGKFVDERWFDEMQIEVLGDGIVISKANTDGPTCSRPTY